LGPSREDFRAKARIFDYPIAGIILLLIAWYIWHKIKEIRLESQEAARANEVVEPGPAARRD
jgi:hypothetical protein